MSGKSPSQASEYWRRLRPRLDLKGLLFIQLLMLAAVLERPVQGNSIPPDSTWQRYKAEGFSVLLPQQPTTTMISRPSRSPLEKEKTGRLFGSYGDGVVYLILSFDNPKRRDSLETFISELVSYPISHDLGSFERDLKGNGFTAKEYRSTAETLNSILRFYLSENRVYLVQAIGADVSGQTVVQFLDSFTIGADLAGKEIRYDNLPLPDDIEIAGNEISPTADLSTKKVFTGKEVTRKARIFAKPPPAYTEEARKRSVTGTVVIRGVFSSSGQVTNLRVLSGLPHGLDEQALLAARTIKFVPAMKDGKYVSMFIQLEYNFNLY